MNVVWRVLFYIGVLWRFHECEQFAVKRCPGGCICLSQTQVMCNSGELREIPLTHMPPTVETLSLQKNIFPVIKSDAFLGLKALRKLSLDRNNITTIKPFAFRGLPRLRDLSIQHTPLATVASFAFAGLQNVSQITLQHNKILQIEAYAFAGSAGIRLLNLADNPTVVVKKNAFSNLGSVDRLILPSGIRNISQDAFSALDMVGYLKLSFMDLTEVSAFTFRGLTNVKLLSLQESDLGVISANAFDGLEHVDTLNILNNKIDAIQELNITYANHIKTLRLQGNHLLETPEPGSITLEGLSQLHVVGNFFPCGCHIHTLLESPVANGTYGSGEDFLSKNYCISPLEVNGLQMSQIDIFAIGRCHEQVTRENLEASGAATRQHYLAVLLGGGGRRPTESSTSGNCCSSNSNNSSSASWCGWWWNRINYSTAALLHLYYALALLAYFKYFRLKIS